MTHDFWVAEWKKRTSDLHFNHGLSHFDARQEAHRRMERDYGPCPPEEPKPPLWARLGSSAFRGLLMPEWLKSFVNKWGVLISVAYLAFVGIMQGLAERLCSPDAVSCAYSTVLGVVQKVAPFVLSFTGITIDPSWSADVTAVLAGVWATWGLSRKLTAEVKKARAKA